MQPACFVLSLIVLVVATLRLMARERRHDMALSRPQLPTTVSPVLELPVFTMTSILPYNRALRHNIRLHRNKSGFRLRVFTESTARSFVHKNCPESAAAYDDLIPKAFKADVARLCMLYHHGGTWLDDDLALERPLDAFDTIPGQLLLIEDNLYLPSHPWRYGIWNAIIIVRRRHHPFIGCALNLATHRVQQHFRGETALSMTGPFVVSECVPAHADINVLGYWKGRTISLAETWNKEVIVRHWKVPRNNSVPAYYLSGRWFYSE